MKTIDTSDTPVITRRQALKLATATMATFLIPHSDSLAAPAQAILDARAKGELLPSKAFVYTELQLSSPFERVSWEAVNKVLLQQPGLLNKTWLVGVGNNSLGGFYAFDSIENAQRFVTGYFPGEARRLGVGLTSRLFDADTVEDASRDMNSPYFGHRPNQNPGAFVYTEVQVSVPFDTFHWRERNAVLKKQPGLLAKTWLSGYHTDTLGGLDAFDTIENALRYALEDLPQTMAKLNAAFYTRVFDARVARFASEQMRSPFFTREPGHSPSPRGSKA